MPDKDESGALLLALQNRLNDLEAKHQKAEKSLEGKSWVDVTSMENKISTLKAEITELLKQKADVKKDVTFIESPKPLGILDWFDSIFK